MSRRASRSPAPRRVLTVLAAAAVAVIAGGADAGISQSGEQKNMRRVGHVDLQGRAAYQPNVIVYPDGRTIAFVGTHGGTRPNTLKPGNPPEENGTMIVDVTDPSRPVEKAHIPVPLKDGQAQMARMCLGSVLPGGVNGHVYLFRNVQGTAASGYEIWDVTDVSNPAPIAAIKKTTNADGSTRTPGIRSTHKDWWECSTGIAYMPGSLDVTGNRRWRTSQSMLIYDWSHPKAPVAPGTAIPVYTDYPKYIRTYGLPGAQPADLVPDAATHAAPNSLHGPISTFEHPQANQPLARGGDVIGNRVYAAWGVGDDGALQIINRKNLLPPAYGGNWVGDPDRPTMADIEAAQAGLLYMSTDQGGHTSMPIFGMTPASYGNFTEFKTRDIIILSSEATADLCQESPHWAFTVDITIENSRSVPPGTKVEQSAWQGPMVLSTMSVDPRRGEKYPRGNYCTRGARFGVHSSEENFTNPYYGRLTLLAYFTGGVRAFDIREPQSPVEVGFYVPVSNQNTLAGGYMTNNLEVDHRGFVYATDRNGSGLDIIELRGKARAIGLGQKNADDEKDED